MPQSDTSGTGIAPAARQTRRAEARTRAGSVSLKRGIYDVARLLYMFEDLGWQVDCAKYEAAMEGDLSQVPAMLGGLMQEMGEVLLEMAAEEIAEALAGRVGEAADDAAEDDSALSTEERQHIAAAGSPQVRAFRRGLAQAKLRAGKLLSTETVRCLRAAKDLHEEAITLSRSGLRKHKEGIAAIDDLLDRAGVSDPDNEDAQTVQTSDGTGKDEGSEGQRAEPGQTMTRDAGFRQRQAHLLQLSQQH